MQRTLQTSAAGYRSVDQLIAASVIKLFYLVAAHR